jgi:hypothetical protein
MGTINKFYFHSVTIRRGVDTSGGKRRYIATGTIDCHLQRADDANGAIDNQLYGATHKLWCDVSTDIKDGDKVFDDKGTEYLVVAVRIDGVDWAINQHQEVLLKKYSN